MTEASPTRSFAALVVATTSFAALTLASAAPRQDGATAIAHEFAETIQPLLQQYCCACHATEKHKGDLDLERFTSFDAVQREPLVWQEIEAQLLDGAMPPKDAPQPDEAQRAQLLKWLRGALEELARAHAGDPGPVVLRRLTNAEYTYTLRDLTGLELLDPAREFPVDGAAGEGFTNVGNALVMSPSLLTKYLAAGKAVAEHAVLTPDGLRFSPSTSRRDWTEELLGEIRAFYRQFTAAEGGDVVDLQGIVFATNGGGRLPLARYLGASLELRDAAPTDGAADGAADGAPDGAPDGALGETKIQAVALRHGLSPKYLATLLGALRSPAPSPLLEPLAAAWRACEPDDVPALAARIVAQQAALWRFNSVGHVGKAGGPKAWLEAVDPLASGREVRFQVPPATDTDVVTLYLVASDAGDGGAHDHAVWQAPRFVADGRPDLLLRDVRDVTRSALARRARRFALAERALAAAADAARDPAGAPNLEALAQRHAVDADSLRAWFVCLGLRLDPDAGGAEVGDTLLTTPLARPSAYDFVAGWGSPDTPSIVANASEQRVQIPGELEPHGIAMHPSPTLAIAVGWRSPVTARMRLAATIVHAHHDCGNGVLWSLELRRGALRRQLAHGAAERDVEVGRVALEGLDVQRGDLLALRIGARDGDHRCDLTAVDLVLTSAADDGHEWDLAKDCSPDVLAGNPHADGHGNEGVWHFYVEPEQRSSAAAQGLLSGPPLGSLLAEWQATTDTAEQERLGRALGQLLERAPLASDDCPDARLYRQLAALRGPLVGSGAQSPGDEPPGVAAPVSTVDDSLERAVFGLAAEAFGKGHAGQELDDNDLGVTAPAVVELRLPADLVAGCTLVAGTGLQDPAGTEGSVQFQVHSERPPLPPALSPALPVVVGETSAARARFESAYAELRQLFPAALCYAQIVPVDEVVTLTQFHREDTHLARLLLDDAQVAELDRLWAELHFVSEDALTQVDAFEQLWQYATQDADPSAFEPLRQPIAARAAAFREELLAAEPKHVDALVRFAERAYRRPLTEPERDELLALYGRLRAEGLAHDPALRLLIARVLVAPAFLYRAERPAPGAHSGPVSAFELASRLSYWLWSSAPDEALLACAVRGELHDPEVLLAQTRRLLRDPRVRRLAVEFGCAALHIHGFAEVCEKSERHFPTFDTLRGAMFEESVLFLTDLFQHNGSLLDLLAADHTFLNAALAEHYGIPGVEGDGWRRVDGVRRYSRGGILGQATTLATQSGASRTSPILRGNWVSEVLLGEKLPRPPKDVPRLPDDGGQLELTMRELTEKHTSDPRCATCHARIDAFGFALEGFDAIGRLREHDLGGRPIDTHVTAPDGTELEGLEGLRGYLLGTRRDAFVRQFCKKLLGYSLGRAVRLSDEPLLAELCTELAAHDYRLDVLFDAIVLSKQFREIRGLDAQHEE
jgi:hypothetical protein